MVSNQEKVMIIRKKKVLQTPVKSRFAKKNPSKIISNSTVDSAKKSDILALAQEEEEC